MHQRLARRAELVSIEIAIAIATCAVFASRAFGHAAPALPPVFDKGPCIQVVERDAAPELHFDYRIAMDDTQLTTGDIVLPDAMTYQFFAFRGAIVFEGFAPEVWAFDQGDPMLRALPLWITRADVMRSQQSSDRDALGYDLSDLQGEAVLETATTMHDRWLRITEDRARVPITLEQAFQGVSWNVKDIEPGLYTVGGYIFSPPWNGWAIRPGLVKIRTADRNPPAAVLDRIQESLFSGQGRRVGACVDAPEGTRVRTFARVQGDPNATWERWGEEAPIEGDRVDHCFHPPDPNLTGSVRLRYDLIAPDGEVASAYSPDTVLFLPGAVPCTDSDTVCCKEAPEPNGADAGAGEVDAGARDDDAAPRAADGGGCHTSREVGGSAWFLLALGSFVARARALRRRASRREPRRTRDVSRAGEPVATRRRELESRARW